MAQIQFVNLTPHAVVIQLPSGERIEIPPSGQVARVAYTRERVGDFGGIPVFRNVWGEVEGIPDPQPGVVYIVSSLVGERANRPDVVSPDTTSAIRDAAGRIIAVTGFQTFA